MATVGIRSRKKKMKAVCHGGRFLGKDFSLVVVFVAQPLARARRTLWFKEQEGHAWRRTVMVDTCCCVGTLGPGAGHSPLSGLLERRRKRLRAGSKCCLRPGPWSP